MGVKISNLPAIVTPALTDIFPVVQPGVTYKETVTQLQTLLGTIGATTITGTANQVIASASVGPVTLSLPQSIGTTSDVTFGSVTFSPTTKGIVGTPTNDNAAAGKVGEFVTSQVSSVSAGTTGSVKDVTSISLTAGDWDVEGNVHMTATTISSFICWISSASATAPATGLYNYINPVGTSAEAGMNAPFIRFSLSGTTTIYLSAQAGFTGTGTYYGGIFARRVR